MELVRSGGPSLCVCAIPEKKPSRSRSNAGAFCNFDPTDNGTQAGLNPALIIRGDVTLRRLVTAIKASPAWHTGNNALIVLWDENDYSTAPETNQVPLIVDTNYGVHGTASATRYTHFSLLKSIEAGLRLPCLNHACDVNVAVMSDLFAVDIRPTAAAPGSTAASVSSAPAMLSARP